MRSAGSVLAVLAMVAGLGPVAPAAGSAAPAGTAGLKPATPGAGSHLLLDASGAQGGGFHRKQIPTGLAIALQPGFAFDPAAVAGVCSDADAKNQKCASDSIVGTGLLDVLAEGYAFGPGGQHFAAKLTFYRAAPRQAGDPAGVVFAFKETSSGFSGTSIGRLKDSDDALFGQEIRWDELPIPDLPPGMAFTLQRLRIDLGAGAATPPVRVRPRHHHPHKGCHRRYHHHTDGRRHWVWMCPKKRRPKARASQTSSGKAFLTNPVTCTGSWQVRLELTYPGATEQRDAAAPCTAAR